MQRKLGRCVSGILSVIMVTYILVNAATRKEGEVIAQTEDCINSGSNVELSNCAAEAYKASNRRLNRVYKKLSQHVRGKERQELVKAEQAWMKFRETQCLFEVYLARMGSGYEGFLSNCLERMTNERIAQLERYDK